MDGSSSQSGSSSYNTVFALGNLEIDNSVSYKQALHVKTSRHSILLKLEENGFITPDEKAKELIKELTGIKYLFNLKLLFENLQNEFSNQILIDALVALADPAPFNLFYSKESAARLELHLRTLIAVLERICFSPIRLTKDLRDKIYNSLTRFAEIHRKTTQVIEEGLENNFRSNYDQFKQQKDDKSDEKIAKKRNYNIDFLLIHLRDTLHSLRDDETWFQEIIRRIRDLLKTALNITPGILSAITGANLPNDCSILSMLNQVRQSLSFKYPVASYYIDWRIMLIVQHNLVIWSECSEMIINSQTKFDEVSNKVIKALKNTGSFLNDLSGNEPLALPYTLWFGILDLAHNLIQKSTRKSIHDAIANEMTCPISSEPTDQLCILKCKHALSLNNLKKLKQKICPQCRKKIVDDDIRYLPQSSIYNNLYSKFSKSGYISPSIELKNSDQVQRDKEAINLKPKKPIAYFICGEVFYCQSNYDEAIYHLNKSLEYKTKINNLYIILGNSNLFEAESFNFDKYYLFDALRNYETALKNDPNNYLCLKNCAYIYERKKYYQNALIFLDKLLSMNENDSLILCYYGEILFKMGKYNNAISYFTKANIIDPENIHNLKKRAITYYDLQEYDEVLSDIDKVIQFDPLNILAYYLKILAYYTKGDINNAKIEIKKCIELILNSNYNILEKTQFFYLKYLLEKHEFTELMYIKLNQISNTKSRETLLFIRCSIHIKLRMYHTAKSDFNMLCESISIYSCISYIHLLQKYLNFWSYFADEYGALLSNIGIIDYYSAYLYIEKEIYLISNLINYNKIYCQFQESDPNSLSGQVLCCKNGGIRLIFPVLDFYDGCIIWKINVKKIISESCFIKFGEKNSHNSSYIGWNVHILKYRDVLKFKGLGWIECKIPIELDFRNSHLIIEMNAIDMKIDYIRFGYNEEEITCTPNMSCLLPDSLDYHEFYPSIPEAFKDKYFSKKETENFFELKDILDNL
ncbi:hypothetical protein GLOIN_2v1869696 [Rhizophagus irregularis DAOM 181602=DAOM 197198]|nr:hypothetical protein GLOIN_2v1869696 [Rhizophagus irregularis DAOM 181602=DAOM 197198]